MTHPQVNRDKRYLRAAQVRARYGDISDMTLWRWLHSPAVEFPKPIYVGRDRFWDEAALDAHDRRCAVRVLDDAAGRVA